MADLELTTDLLLQAYAAGIFPMAEARDDPEVFWVDPRRRGIIPLDGFHVSQSLRKRILRAEYRVALNEGFAEVLDGCADRDETWINATIRGLMLNLHRQGFAHCFSVWHDARLCGGVYGVAIGGAFFGESMFSYARDASKVALAYGIDHLKRSGVTIFDAQFLTEHLASLGAIEVSRNEYHLMLETALSKEVDITRLPIETDPQAVVQRMTQIS